MLGILIIGLVAILIATWRLMKEQANMISIYKEIEGILNEKIELLEEYVELLKS
jgi:hypothetical protein